ncbi:MAG: hypothetical protein K0R71_1275 [Bacillales bacterium]|nr:hypothetical protein [Bacillales bacterium]
MVVSVMKIKLFAPWVHSLKEKRMIVKSLCERIKNKFNVSVIESEAQDIHQTIIIGIAYLAPDHVQVDRIKETLLTFIESHTDAEIIGIQFEER